MPKRPYQRSLKTRVPVYTAGNPRPELESHPRPVGLNKRHERQLIEQLEQWYGWRLALDGNLYSPSPSVHALESNAA
jgi:hypothetical protein